MNNISDKIDLYKKLRANINYISDLKGIMQ